MQLSIIAIFLILSFIPIEEKEPPKEPTVDITESLFGGTTYEGGIIIPDTNKSITLICKLPSFLNITRMFPQTEVIETEEGKTLIWKDQNTIQLNGIIEPEFNNPFNIQASFEPSTARKRENSQFELNIFRLSEINKKYNEFIDLIFICRGCSIKPDNPDLDVIVDSSSHEFYAWTVWMKRKQILLSLE